MRNVEQTYPPAIQIDPMAGFGDVPQRSRSEVDGYDPCGAHGQVFKPETPELDAATVGDVRDLSPPVFLFKDFYTPLNVGIGDGYPFKTSFARRDGTSSPSKASM